MIRALDQRGSAQLDDRDRGGGAPRCHPVVPGPLPSREKSQGLGNQLIVPESGMENHRELVVRRERLGGLPSY